MMCGSKSCNKIFCLIIVGIAVLLAILATILPQERIDYVIVISRFFEIMIPVLGVGALIKYLGKDTNSCCHTHGEGEQHTHHDH